MKIIHDRVIDTASGRKSRNPSRAEGLGAVTLCRSLVAYHRGCAPHSLRAHNPNSSQLAMRGLFRQSLTLLAKSGKYKAQQQ